MKTLDYGQALEMFEQALLSLDVTFMRDRRWIAMHFVPSARSGPGRHDEGREQPLELREKMKYGRVVFRWYCRMPLRLKLTEAYLRKAICCESEAR